MCTAVMSFMTKVITILQVKTYVVTPLEGKSYTTTCYIITCDILFKVLVKNYPICVYPMLILHNQSHARQ